MDVREKTLYYVASAALSWHMSIKDVWNNSTTVLQISTRICSVVVMMHALQSEDQEFYPRRCHDLFSKKGIVILFFRGWGVNKGGKESSIIV